MHSNSSVLRPRIIMAGLLASTTLTACQSINTRKEQGAVMGASAGGVAGGLIGRANGSTAKGAILGAAVGGALGAVIGHQMDQRAKTIEQRVAGATVERVGEGIQVTFESGLLFDTDSDRIRAEAANNLRNLATTLNEDPDTELLIVGHTDSRGEDAYNQQLSERRARATSDFMAAQGIARTRLRTMGRGESEPVADNTSDMGLQKNRRVEVAIFASEAMKNRLRGQ